MEKLLLKHFCAPKSQLLEPPWAAIKTLMAPIPELRHMVFIGPLQHLMTTMPDSSILPTAERYFFYNLTWKKAGRFRCGVLRRLNDFPNKIITLRLEIAQQMDEAEIMGPMISQGQELLNQLGENEGLKEDIAHFRRVASNWNT